MRPFVNPIPIITYDLDQTETIYGQSMTAPITPPTPTGASRMPPCLSCHGLDLHSSHLPENTTLCLHYLMVPGVAFRQRELALRRFLNSQSD